MASRRLPSPKDSVGRRRRRRRSTRRLRHRARTLSIGDVDQLTERAREVRAERLRKSPDATLPAGLQAWVDQGWRLPEGWLDEGRATALLALDLGEEATSVTAMSRAGDLLPTRLMPTAICVDDPHAFRSFRATATRRGLEALAAWPSRRVLLGTRGELALPLQLGLCRFPADHGLAALVEGERTAFGTDESRVVLTLPTFLPQIRRERIRERCASPRRGAFPGVPAGLASAAFHLLPGFSEDDTDWVQWARRARRGVVLVLDWGASGLAWTLCRLRDEPETRRSKSDDRPGPRARMTLIDAGVWPSLGGRAFAREIASTLRRGILEKILATGPSQALTLRSDPPGPGRVPRPLGYEDAFRALTSGRPLDPAERTRCEQRVFPTDAELPPELEPEGFAPYRRFAAANARTLLGVAEQVARGLLTRPDLHRSRGRGDVPLAQLAGPFLSLDETPTVSFDPRPWLDSVERRLDRLATFLRHRLDRYGQSEPSFVATGRAAGSPLLERVTKRLRAAVNPAEEGVDRRPSRSRATVNLGALLLRRLAPAIKVEQPPELLPLSIATTHGAGSMRIVEPGPLDELTVFQRRVPVEDGRPSVEYLSWRSEDGSRSGWWGVLRFDQPFDFRDEDRRVDLDPRFGLGGKLPRLRDSVPAVERCAASCFDPTRPRPGAGRVAFRRLAMTTDTGRRLVAFLDRALLDRFHTKVFLLEREFDPPPRRRDELRQRYYLSRSQELLVVREWWAPGSAGELIRRKELYSCQGRRSAHELLAPERGGLR